MQNSDIKIYTIPLKVEMDRVREGIDKDEALHDVIVKYSEELAGEGIETWTIEDNIIVTESGYKIAIYEAGKEEQTYIEKCEYVVKTLVNIILNAKLQGHFSQAIIQDALSIKNVYNAKQGTSNKT